MYAIKQLFDFNFPRASFTFHGRISVIPKILTQAYESTVVGSFSTEKNSSLIVRWEVLFLAHRRERAPSIDVVPELIANKLLEITN